MSPLITPPARDLTRRHRQTWLAVVVIAAAALLAYGNSLRVPFLFDDRAAILENPTIRQLWPPLDAISPPSDGRGVSGRPLVNLSLALNYAIGGPGVFGYHAFNLALHLGSALLLYGILRRTLSRPGLPERIRPAAFPLALGVALIWTVHPLLTETVTGVIQRTEGMVGFFYLLTLYSWVRGLDSASRRKAWFAAATASCFAGMATKEVMVSAPLIVLLYDRTFAAGSLAAAWRQRWSLYLGLASSWLLLIFLMSGSRGRGGTVGFGLGVSSWDYLLTQCRALTWYLKLALWPAPLVVDYGTTLARGIGDVWLPGLAILALLTATVLALVRRPKLGFLGAWFFIILAPSSSFVPLASQTIAEHRMYLPLAAIVTGLALAAYQLGTRRASIACSVAGIALGVVTVRRNTIYQSELSLWTQTVAEVPDNVRARTNLGNTLFHLGRSREAIAQFEAALRLDPQSAPTHLNLASAYCRLARPAEAIPHGEMAVRLAPRDPDGYVNLGNALLGVGRASDAVANYESALRLQPEAADTELNLAMALTQLGRSRDAIGHFERALRSLPANAETLFTLGNAFAREERFADAAAAYRRTLAIDSQHVGALANLGSALLASGHAREAIAAYEAALRLEPGDRRLRENLALARATPGGG